MICKKEKMPQRKIVHDGLSNKYVNFLAKKCISNFRAVLPSDIFSKKKLSCGDKYIVNLAPSYESMGHFVVVCVEKDHFDFMDPYGLPVYNQFINKAFLKKPKFEVKHFKQDIQGLGKISYFCGFYCLCYLICKEKKITKKQFGSLFSRSFKDNEKICMSVIKKYLLEMK